MEGGSMAELLTAIAILFIIAGPFLLVANRYDLPAAPLLIVSGIVAGFLIQEELTRELAQFGITLLVFSFGVSIQLSSIESVLRDSELAAVGQVFVIGVLGIGFGLLVGVPLEESVFLGVAAALSSTIVATALLRKEIQTDLIRGRLGQSIQFVQDLLAIGFLLIIGAEVWSLDPIVLQIGYGVVFLGGAVLVNRYGFGMMTRLAGGSTELMIIGIISILAVFIGAATAVDIPIVVGAFAAGLAVRYDPGAHPGLFNGLESIKDFFVAIFFASVGALVVLPFIEIGVADSVEKMVLVAGLVLLTVLVKPAITIALLIHRGYETRTATLTGLSTDQVSEFGLIIAIEALLLGLLTQAVFDAIILTAAITMVTSSVTQRYDEELYRALSNSVVMPEQHGKIDSLSEVPATLDDHVIILGYGQKGARLVDTMESLDHPYVVIENDPARYDAVSHGCDAFVFGDAMEPYTWELAGADNALVIVSVTSSEVVSRRLLSYDFETSLILRAPNELVARGYLDDGADYAVVPDLLAAEELTSYLRELLAGDLSGAELQALGQESK